MLKAEPRMLLFVDGTVDTTNNPTIVEPSSHLPNRQLSEDCLEESQMINQTRFSLHVKYCLTTYLLNLVIRCRSFVNKLLCLYL